MFFPYLFIFIRLVFRRCYSTLKLFASFLELLLRFVNELRFSAKDFSKIFFPVSL